jgi:plasmid stabilization system protein ParE
MEKKGKVVFRDKALHSIRDIALYIALQGYPETAEKFTEKLVDFGKSLGDFPNAYPLCYLPQFSRRKMRCVLFHKNYIFVYKAVKNTLFIYNVIHCNTNPAFQAV